MYPMYQPIPMVPPNMNYSSYRQTVNGQQNRNTPRPSGQQRNGNGRQNIDPTPLSECGPVQREGNPSQRQANNQIVTFSDARPMVTTSSGGSEIQLMSRVVKAINPDTPRQIEMNAGLMLNPGSSGTYISSELSSKLKLYNGPKKEVGLIRFGDKSASARIKGSLNVLGIRDVEGNIIRVRGIVVPEFAPSMPCVSLQKEDLDQRECGTMPQRKNMKPGILLGMDYLHHIKLRFMETLPCGYSVYDSTIGPFICGQANEPNGGNLCLATVMATLASATEEREQLISV